MSRLAMASYILACAAIGVGYGSELGVVGIAFFMLACLAVAIWC